MVEGEWLSVEDAWIFNVLLMDAGDWRPNDIDFSLERIDPGEVVELGAPFIEDEVFKALCGFSGNKVLEWTVFRWSFGSFHRSLLK